MPVCRQNTCIMNCIMVCNIRTFLPLVALSLLICSCSGDCCFPDECPEHGHGKTIVIEACLPEGQQTESFHLIYNGREYNSLGRYFTIPRTHTPVSILVFNNDGESNVFDSQGNASTNQRYDNKSLNHEPSPLYAYAVRDTFISSDTDTLRLHLLPKVCQYNIFVELANNDKENKVTQCQQVIMTGLAKGINLWNNQRQGSASFEAYSTYTNDTIAAHVQCWGKTDGRVYLSFAFIQGRHSCWFEQDVSDIIDSIPFGGDIHLRIDVATQLDSIPPSTGNIDVGVGDWNNEETELTI